MLCLHNSNILATNSVVVLHCMSQFYLGVLLFHDHESFSLFLVVSPYFLVYSSFLRRKECFVDNRLDVWQLKMQFCDQAHTASEHATYL